VVGFREAWKALVGAREATYQPVDALGNPEGAYRSLTAGYEARPITAQERERYIAIARRIYATDAAGGGLADAVVARVIGDELTWDVPDPKVMAIVERFVCDPDNDLDAEFPRYCTELVVFGELVLPIFVTKENGDARLGYLLPEQVEDVIWRKGDAKRALAVLQKRPGADESRYLWIIPRPDVAHDGHYPPHPALTPETEPHSVDGVDGLPVALPTGADGEVLPEIRKELDAGDVKVAGYAFYHRTGCLVSGRGRGIYWRTKDWLKALDDHVFAALRNAVLRARYVFTVTLDGAQGPEIEKKQRQLNANPPAPGTVLVKGSGEHWDVVAPGVPEAEGIQELATLVQKLIGLAEGVPAHEMAAEADVNRNTASESRQASLKRAKRLQREIAAMVTEWVSYQVDQKMHAGQLPAEADRTAQPVLPDLDARDEALGAQSVAQAVPAMVTAVTEELVLQEDARAYLYALMGRKAPEKDEWAKALADAASKRDQDAYSGVEGKLEAMVEGSRPAQGSGSEVTRCL